jgi:CheY-like chemotaxis protein
MRILLVDDNIRHRRAGVQQLEALGHEVIAFCGYEEARATAMKDKSFRVALIDLLMPAEPFMLGPDALEKYVGVEIGIGFPLALELARLGIPKIAIATDASHHAHPMSAVVDWFEGGVWNINATTLHIMRAPMTQDGPKNWAKILERLLA